VVLSKSINSKNVYVVLSSRYDSLAEKAKKSLELTVIEKLVTSSDLFASQKQINCIEKWFFLKTSIQNVYLVSSSRYDSLAEKAKESLELTVIQKPVTSSDLFASQKQINCIEKWFYLKASIQKMFTLCRVLDTILWLKKPKNHSN